MSKKLYIGIGAAALVVGITVVWFGKQPDSAPADSNATSLTEEAALPDDGVVSMPQISTPHFTTEMVATSGGLVHDPQGGGTAYLNANAEGQVILNKFVGRIVVRSKIVEIDREYTLRIIQGVVRDTAALSGGFEGALSETLNIAMFPDTPCTLSYFASGFRGPRTRSVETSPGVFSLVEDEGEVVLLRSHCGSNNETTAAEVRIDTTEETVRVELVNERVVQQLISLDTEGFMLAVEFDAQSFPQRSEHVDLLPGP